MDWTWYLFRFDGRINRAKLWLAMLVLLGVMMTVGLLIVAIHSLFGSAAPFHFGASDLFKLVDPDAYRSLTWADLPRLLIKLVGTSLLMWVYFAISIKRLHDRDKSGWWMVPFFAVPGLYNQFADRLPDSYCRPAAGHCRVRSCSVGLRRDVLPEGLAQDQPLRRRPAGAASAARYAAALGPAERDRNGAAQGWPAAGLAC